MKIIKYVGKFLTSEEKIWKLVQITDKTFSSKYETFSYFLFYTIIISQAS